MVILWSDYLVFALLLLAIVAGYFGMRDEITRSSWQKAYAQPIRMIAMTILCGFILIGLLDSMHYLQNDTNQVLSVLDWLLKPIAATTETSYSAPFATHLFVENMVRDASGAITWIAPPLQHVIPVPILPQVLLGASDALIFWIFATALMWLIIIKICRCNIKLNSPWLIGWLTVGVITLFTIICWRLLNHYHIFGTDKIGGDVFYATIKSIRTGLIIGILTTIITLPFAILCGALAGYFGGLVDDVIQYIYITLSSIPGVLLIAAAVLSLEVIISQHSEYFSLTAQRIDARLLLLCSILGITSWTMLCRILRGETLKLREQDFILASRAMGLNSWQIIVRHIVPNLTHIILISIVLDFSGLVLAEAVLSYVGVGVDPATYSWGNMINAARLEMAREPIVWWSLVGAFIFMFALVLSANIFADGVRDAFDPRSH